MTIRPLLQQTAEMAADYLAGAAQRPVAGAVAMDDLLRAFGGPLPAEPSDPAAVVQALAKAADPGLVVTNAGRYFGFVEGGVLPAALAADWLVSTWDQNPGFFALSPAAAAAEETCRTWLCELLGLPATASAGFTTGAQMANLAGLAAGRHAVLAKAGWDVEADGLYGAPPLQVLVGEQRHATIPRALRFLGLGEQRVTTVPADGEGRMIAGELAGRLQDGPAIVCVQAGNVNSGAFDPLEELCAIAHDAGAWVHVDGAFGMWAATAPARRHLTAGIEHADSWATDAHKWLNVPYDSGIVFCADPDSHRAAMSLTAAYLARTGSRDGTDWTPESSRRARAFPIWAALQSLGARGVGDMIETCCAHAQRFADILADDADIAILNEVVLNQVLVRIGDDDERTQAAAATVQADGAAWLGTTQWHGQTAIRISVSDQATTTEDVQAAAGALLAATRS